VTTVHISFVYNFHHIYLNNICFYSYRIPVENMFLKHYLILHVPLLYRGRNTAE
jgi:hypothetical protein